MKNFILIFFISLSINLFAQKDIEEGFLKSKTTISSENEQIKSQLSMMGDLISYMYFKGNNSRSEMKNPISGSNIMIVNGDAKKTLLLLDNPMMGKLYKESDINISKEDLSNINFTETGDSKTILGYECKGYDFVIKTNGFENKITMYTTDKVKATNQNNLGLGSKSKGIPMYIVTDVTEAGIKMKMIIEVIEIRSESVEDAKFKLAIPDGYSKMEDPKPANID